MWLLMAPLNIWRLMRVVGTFARSGAAGMMLKASSLSGVKRLLIRAILLLCTPLGLRGDPTKPPLLRALMALGPVYIKVGQSLSTRPDIVGDRLAAELRELQDKLPHFPQNEAEAEIEAAFGQPVSGLFARLEAPVAAASVAQVHPAFTYAGDKVAVKILRPGIRNIFRRNQTPLLMGARFLEFFSPSSKRIRPVAVIENFIAISDIELDLRLEAAAASELAENTREDTGFIVPAVHWPLTARNVLTTEWVEGIPASDVEALRAAGHNMKALGERVLQHFLRHALRDGFFHADMHQGNLKIGPGGELLVLDFGIMGRIDMQTRLAYAHILMGYLDRDYMAAAEAHRLVGYLPPDQSVPLFAQALRSVGEPIFGEDARDISMGKLLEQLFAITETFGMETRTELILLQKTMVVVEGVARSFDPEVNIWDAGRPVIEGWVKDNFGPKGMRRDMEIIARRFMQLGPRLPDLAEELVMRAHGAGPNPPRLPRRDRSALWLAAACGAGLMGLVNWLL